ncbi:MAG: LysR family transcriptional regulator [Candidatus Weimeria sp.]
MNTKQMQYILELSHTLNFNRAAENLFISQPTLTYQIRAAEDELGFRIFDRSGKGASLTPAGSQFVTSLRNIYNEYNQAVWQGQNFSAKYREDIRIGMPIRSAIYFLPDAIRQMLKEHPDISVTPSFDWYRIKDSFLNGELDILFNVELDMNQVPDVKKHHLFDSRIYLVCRHDDPLADRPVIRTEDFIGRTLMVGGPSQAPLRRVQNRVVSRTHCNYFNSSDHYTSLTNVAAGRALVLSPGFLNDHTDEFVWIPFDCEENIPCALYTHATDTRESISHFIDVIKSQYPADFPV